MKTKITVLNFLITIVSVMVWSYANTHFANEFGEFSQWQNIISHFILFIFCIVLYYSLNFDEEIKEYENLKNRVEELEKKINNNLKK